MMHPKKFIDKANESYQQYQDGLISKAEWLATLQVAIHEMIDHEVLCAKNTLESFGIEVNLNN
jgi:hypothetical protein